jgi:EmrB/QacA subfamily drug resistance transporter
MSGRAGARLAGHVLLIVMIVACAYFMEFLDSTIIVTAIPKMAESFSVDPTRMSLGVTAYLLATAAAIPASSWVADRWGARNVFFAAMALFTIASMACGLAPTFATFIAARGLQGVAAAMMSPVGRLVVLRSVPKGELMPALSLLVWPALFAPVIGPPLGGLITGALTWRWIFFINLPIGLAGLALVLLYIPNEKSDRQAPFDWPGFVLMGMALACLTYGMDVIGQAGNTLMGLVMFAVAAVLGLATWRHIRRHPHPVLAFDALRHHSFLVSSLSGGLVSRAAISATPFLLPLMFQLGFGLSPVVSGLLLLFYMGANLAMKAITNPILRRWGIPRVLVVNGLLASLGICLCGLVTTGMPLVASGAILAFAGATRSMQFTALTMVTFADVTPAQRAPASVLFSLTQQVGMGMGVAVGALMLNFSQLLRHDASLGLFDFRVALVFAGLLSALAVLAYRTLAPDAGAEISGHKPA